MKTVRYKSQQCNLVQLPCTLLYKRKYWAASSCLIIHPKLAGECSAKITFSFLLYQVDFFICQNILLSKSSVIASYYTGKGWEEAFWVKGSVALPPTTTHWGQCAGSIRWWHWAAQPLFFLPQCREWLDMTLLDFCRTAETVNHCHYCWWRLEKDLWCGHGVVSKRRQVIWENKLSLLKEIMSKLISKENRFD